ncbi:MAG: ATP-binding protein [Deltaproteobacteria bacterium]|nr:ATP-binding protein [Deltaproteobacteria bacterium]
MLRSLYQKLLDWKDSLRRKPLILQGARQVGKTYLIKEFGTKEYADVAYFNFEEKPKLVSLFENELSPAALIQSLQIELQKKIEPQKTLMIWDEVQVSPNALNSLKYFYENNPEYHLICAGSLLGITLGQQKSFPVGKVNFLNLYPLSFVEFLQALGFSELLSLLKEKKDFSPLPELFHQKLIAQLKLYYFLGGMPEVVKNYLQNQDLLEARTIQQEILRSYLLDFSKHAQSVDVIKIQQVWGQVPSQLAKENKKFSVSELHKNARLREYRVPIQWLLEAGLLQKVGRVSLPKIPLNGYLQEGFSKLYLLDTGLLGALLELTPKTLIEGNELFTHFHGAQVENFVAQELLTYCEKPIYYWSSQGRAEVDFLVSLEEEIIPIEVKAGENTRSRSLGEYVRNYHPEKALRFSLRNYHFHNGASDIPLYDVFRILSL